MLNRSHMTLIQPKRRGRGRSSFAVGVGFGIIHLLLVEALIVPAQDARSLSVVSNNEAKSSSRIDLITPESVRPLVVTLAGDEFGGRGAGYSGEKKAAEFIAREFKNLGLKPAGDLVGARRSYFQEFKFHPHHPISPWELLTSRNVLGFFEGEDPLLKQEVVVIGAHYDGQGRLAEADPFRKPPLNSDPKINPVWYSANDNLTGVSAVLAAARAMKQGHAHSKRTILFAAFGCEEHGMSGSINYVTHPFFELSRHVAMINYEKLGRSPDNPLTAGATGTSPDWGSLLKDASAATGTQIKALIPFVVPDSVHYAFAAIGIPSVILSVNGPDDAHRPGDTAEKISFSRVAEYARYGLAILLELANRSARITYADVRGLDPGLIAHLASDEECDNAGIKAPECGLKVTGIIPGRAADLAGLKSGDLMLSFAGTNFRRDMTLQILQKMQMEIVTGRLGTKIPLKILRDKKELALTLDLDHVGK